MNRKEVRWLEESMKEEGGSWHWRVGWGSSAVMESNFIFVLRLWELRRILSKVITPLA